MADFEQLKWVEILKAYKNVPALWNESHADFANPKVRQVEYNKLLQIYQEIDDESDLKAFKQQLQIMRKCFTREFLKTQAIKDYKSKLWYFDLMSFLITQIKRKQGHAVDDVSQIANNNKIKKDKALAVAQKWTSAVNKLTSPQQECAKKAIEQVLVLAAKNRLEWNCEIHLKETIAAQSNDQVNFTDIKSSSSNAKEANVSEPNQTADKIEQWICKICNQVLRSNAALCNHMKSKHNVSRPFECDICDAKFADETNFQTHRRRHLDIRLYLCPLCGKKFITSTELKIHNRTHTKEKPFVCKICQKPFMVQSSLTDHLRQHSNVYAFKCHICDKSFKLRASWRFHLKTHTNVKPFSCEVCGKSFLKRTTLKTHMELHSGLKPYKCACSAEFAQKAGLFSHKSRCAVAQEANVQSDEVDIEMSLEVCT